MLIFGQAYLETQLAQLIDNVTQRGTYLDADYADIIMWGQGTFFGPHLRLFYPIKNEIRVNPRPKGPRVSRANRVYRSYPSCALSVYRERQSSLLSSNQNSTPSFLFITP